MSDQLFYFRDLGKINEVVISLFYVGVNFCYRESNDSRYGPLCVGDTLITHNTAAIFSVIMNGNITLHYNNARKFVRWRKAFTRFCVLSRCTTRMISSVSSALFNVTRWPRHPF